MRSLSIITALLLCGHLLVAQDSPITVSAGAIAKQNLFYLNDTSGWVYKTGNDAAYALAFYNTAGWKRLKPFDVTRQLADKDGNMEGWFRIKLVPDSSFINNSLNLIFTFIGGRQEVYIDGKLVGSYGRTNSEKRSFQNVNNAIPLVPGMMQPGKPSVIAVHFKNKLPSFPLNLIYTDNDLKLYIELKGPEIYDRLDHYSFYAVLWVTACTVLAVLFWLLAFQNRQEKNLWLIAACTSCFSISAYTFYAETVMLPLFMSKVTIDVITLTSNGLIIILMVILTARIFTHKVPRFVRGCIIAFASMDAYAIFGTYYPNVAYISAIIGGLIILFYYVITCWKKIKGSQWAIVLGILCAAFFGTIYFMYMIFLVPSTFLILSIAFLALPVSLLVYVSLRFREIINEVRINASRLVQVTEEKRQHALNQQKILQEEVDNQTADLRSTLDNLKSTQSQLIQSEKMASLGELTAGIAHEIQNPLNFVNNFSDVNKELLEELKAEADKGNIDEVKSIANDVIDNSEKINHHGKRADAIVKGMLQHSRSSTGVMEPTDINALADEYLRLAYHGLRAKDKDFNATMKTDFDNGIGKINIIPQDIGRVLLNLYNNAFYAVAEKKKQQPENYEPTVSVSTKKLDNKITINVSDNGNGIPQKIVDKIFQPFFTTKPTGQGTGLGLSLSYDIIKAHGGEIKVETDEGEGTAFIIQL
jgi:signal transduction histidine kinase